MKLIRTPKTTQSGQAIAEFLVAVMLVIGVLFLAIAMLGKFNDVRNKTLMGSRYIAWERTVWLNSDTQVYAEPQSDQDWYAAYTYGDSTTDLTKSDNELQHEFLHRVVAANGAPIAGSDRSNDQLPAAQQAMWADYGGKAFISAANAVVASTGIDDGPAANLVPYTAQPFGDTMQTVDGTFTAKMDLPTRNQQSGTLSVAIAQNSDTLKRLWAGFDGLTFTDTNVLLTNTWLPEGSDKGKKLFAAAVPAANATLVPPSLYLGMAKYAPEITTTAQIDFGRIRQDIIPSNRVYVAPPVGENP